MTIEELRKKAREAATDAKSLLNQDEVSEEDREEATELREKAESFQERAEEREQLNELASEDEATEDPVTQGGGTKSADRPEDIDPTPSTESKDQEIDAELKREVTSTWMLNGQRAYKQLETEEEKRAFNTLVDEEGAFDVHPEISDEILQRPEDPRYIRTRASIDSTSNKSIEKMAKDVVPNVVSMKEMEKVPKTDANGLGRVTYTPKKHGAYTEFTREEIRESSHDIVDEVLEEFQEGFLNQEEDDFLHGDGVTTARGILQADDIESRDGDGTDSPFSYDLLNEFETDLKAKYRNKEGVVMIMHRKTLAAIRGIVDASDRPILRGQDDGVATAQPNSVLGYPVLESEYLDAPSDASAGDPLVIFGNLRQYQIVDGEEIRMERVTGEGLQRSDKVGYLMFKSYTGDVINSEAFKIFNK